LESGLDRANHAVGHQIAEDTRVVRPTISVIALRSVQTARSLAARTRDERQQL
jgi:hypothetical protein